MALDSKHADLTRNKLQQSPRNNLMDMKTLRNDVQAGIDSTIKPINFNSI